MKVDKIIYSFLIISVIVFSEAHIFSQAITQADLDKLEYEELLTLFNEFEQDSTNQELIARTYLSRARAVHDTIKMARGYDRLARIFHSNKNIAFADSVISLTQHLKHKTYPALGYMIKGYEYKMQNDLVNSFSNFKDGFDFSLRSQNIQQQVYIMDNLISIKSLWGNKSEALNLQRQRNKLIRSEGYLKELKLATRKDANIQLEQLYLSELLASTSSYVYCFLNLKQYDSATYYARQGYKYLKNYSWLEKDKYNLWFLEAEMEISYYQARYEESIASATELIQVMSSSPSDSRLFNIYLFMGLSELGLKNYKKGYHALLMSDSIYDHSDIHITPNQRNLFKLLLDYNIAQDDKVRQIEYLNKLIHVDSLFKINYRYFEPDMIRNFETPRLIKEKEALIQNLREKNLNSKRTIRWVASILIISIFLLIYYIKRQQQYKKRFDLMMLKLNGGDNRANNETHCHEISVDLVNEILEKLTLFESQNGFLSNHVSLISLAKDFGTNPNYLSRIINMRIGKNFSQYLNDLRINYAIQNVFSDRKLRRYTIKAIAEECGYRNAESFSKAFYKRHKIYPSYYLKKLFEQEAKRSK